MEYLLRSEGTHQAITRKPDSHSKLERSQRCLFSEPADSGSADTASAEAGEQPTSTGKFSLQSIDLNYRGSDRPLLVI
mgnify:CR=1 FL=1